MELQDALQQIDEIHRHMAEGRMFRGYRSIRTGASGVIALLAAGAQAWVIPAPAQAVGAYLALWIAVAAASIVIVAGGLVIRYFRLRSALQRQMTSLAAEHLLPAVLAGALLTAVLWLYAPDVLWMAPGLWAIIFSLGVFASSRLLPAATIGVASYYMLSGLFCLALARGEHAFSPWAMALTFGVGQLLAAGLLYWTLERKHGRETESQTD